MVEYISTSSSTTMSVSNPNTESKIYVVNNASNSVSVINASSGKVVDTIMGNFTSPVGAVFDPADGFIYVPNSIRTNISTPGVVIISTSNDSIIAARGTDEGSGGVYDPINERVYLLSPNLGIGGVYSGVNFVNTTLNVNCAPPGYAMGNEWLCYPTGVAFDPANDKLYLSTIGQFSTVLGLNTFSGQTTDYIQVVYHGSCNGISYANSNGLLYVACGASNAAADGSVYILNTTTDQVSGSILVGINPTGIIYDPSNQNLYVTDAGSGSRPGNVTVISTISNAVIKTIPVGLSPYGIAFDPVNNIAYVSNSGSDTVSMINATSNSVLGQPILVGNQPLGLAVATSTS